MSEMSIFGSGPGEGEGEGTVDAARRTLLNPSGNAVVVIYIVLLLLLVSAVYLHCKPVAVMRFYRDSCPHCVASQPAWDAYAVKADLFVMNVDCDTPSGADLQKRYGVQSVPTVIFISPGRLRTYNGDRTVDGYMSGESAWSM